MVLPTRNPACRLTRAASAYHLGVPISARLRVLIAAATIVAAPLLALALPGTAGAAGPVGAAESTPSPAPSECTPPVPQVGCTVPTPDPTLEPTETPTPTPTATASPTPTATGTPTSSPTPRRTSSPRPRSTYTVSTGSTADPVSGSVDVGGLAIPSESATPSPDTKASSSAGGSGDRLTRLLVLVLGAGLLLGVGGATGLYLTRHHHE